MACVAVCPQRGAGHAPFHEVLIMRRKGRTRGRLLGALPPSLTGCAETQAVPAEVWADSASDGPAPRLRRAVRSGRPTAGVKRVRGRDVGRIDRRFLPSGARPASPGALFIPLARHRRARHAVRPGCPPGGARRVRGTGLDRIGHWSPLSSGTRPASPGAPFMKFSAWGYHFYSFAFLLYSLHREVHSENVFYAKYVQKMYKLPC